MITDGRGGRPGPPRAGLGGRGPGPARAAVLAGGRAAAEHDDHPGRLGPGRRGPDLARPVVDGTAWLGRPWWARLMARPAAGRGAGQRSRGGQGPLLAGRRLAPPCWWRSGAGPGPVGRRPTGRWPGGPRHRARWPTPPGPATPSPPAGSRPIWPAPTRVEATGAGHRAAADRARRARRRLALCSIRWRAGCRGRRRGRPNSSAGGSWGEAGRMAGPGRRLVQVAVGADPVGVARSGAGSAGPGAAGRSARSAGEKGMNRSAAGWPADPPPAPGDLVQETAAAGPRPTRSIVRSGREPASLAADGPGGGRGR